MNSVARSLAVSVIERASRELPADRVLRETLKKQRGVSRAATREASRAVFDYYRWKQWVAPDLELVQQLHETTQLASQYKAEPQQFADVELMARAIPPWTATECEVTALWARVIQTQPTLWLRAKRGCADRVASELGDCARPKVGALPEALRYAGKRDLFREPLFQEGLFEVQDITSQAVGLACNPKPGEKWWDACAGEGGKTLHLSDLMENKGMIWASDQASWRLEKLKRRASRAQVFNYRTKVWLGNEHLPTRTLFDGVLVDAPCSGVGTWQRNPHARWTTSPEDVRELSLLQQRLLAEAATAVSVGGRLIYSVCTLTRSETEKVAAAFDAQHPSFARLPITNPLDDASVPSPALLLRPEQSGGGGMFIAAWRRLA